MAGEPPSGTWGVPPGTRLCDLSSLILRKSNYPVVCFAIFHFLFFCKIWYFFPRIGLRDLKIRIPEVKICLGTNFDANPTKF